MKIQTMIFIKRQKYIEIHADCKVVYNNQKTFLFKHFNLNALNTIPQ